MKLCRAFSGVSRRPPSFLKSLGGGVISYPKGAQTKFDERPVALVGLDALQLFLEEHSEADALRNTAQLKYIENRDSFLRSHKGMWLAVSSNNQLFCCHDEHVARSFAAKHFYSKNEDYFVQCIGSEVLRFVDMGMGGFTVVKLSEIPHEVGEPVCVDAEYSFDQGATFQPARMKFASSAPMMGAPKEIISEYKTLVRGSNEILQSPTGETRIASTYEGAIIRVNGTPVTTRIVECDEWLLGYPVYSKFVTSIDTDRTPPVLMVSRDHGTGSSAV